MVLQYQSQGCSKEFGSMPTSICVAVIAHHTVSAAAQPQDLASWLMIDSTLPLLGVRGREHTTQVGKLHE